MNRRTFIKTGLLYIPTVFACRGGTVRMGNLEPEVSAWMVRVLGVSGNYTSASVVCNDGIIKGLKANNLRTSIVRLNSFTGIGINSVKAPLIRDLGVGINDDTGNFVNGDLSESVGLTGNGSTKVILSGATQADLYGLDATNHSFTYGAYVCTSNNQSGFAMGVYNGTDYCYLYVSNAGGQTFFATGISANQITVADSAGTGLYVGSYNSTTDAKIYKRGVQFGTTATPGATFNQGFWVGVFDVNNQNSGTVAPSTKTFGGYFAGRGIAAASQPVLNDIF